MAFPPQALISFKKYIPPSSSLLNEEEGAYIFLMKQMPVISTLIYNPRYFELDSVVSVANSK
jgi:hypothetical protein